MSLWAINGLAGSYGMRRVSTYAAIFARRWSRLGRGDGCPLAWGGVAPARDRFRELRAYLFDVDGTLVYHDRAVPGVADALHALKASGKPIVAVTNNSSLGQHALGERFRRFGLPLEDHEVFSALVATAQYVANEQPGARVLVFGNQGLRDEAERAGLVLTDSTDADYVIVGNHHTISYDNLTTALRALLQRRALRGDQRRPDVCRPRRRAGARARACSSRPSNAAPGGRRTSSSASRRSPCC